MSERFNLTGRVAIITGGAGMLGREHAAAVAAAGGHAVIADVNGAAAAEAALVTERIGPRSIGVTTDVTVEDDVARLVRTTLDTFGRIDILINNAAMTVKGGGLSAREYFAPFERYPLELWQRALDINLTGTFLCCRAIGSHMAAQGHGVILNIASDVGTISPDHRIYEGVTSPHTGEPFNTPASYAATKAAIINLTRYLATYWAPNGVRVNALSPGGVFAEHDPVFVQNLTSRIPLGRMARRDEYREAVLFLISDASSYVTGANLLADGGRTAW